LEERKTTPGGNAVIGAERKTQLDRSDHVSAIHLLWT
jgi:hypothetical protein